MNSVTIARHEVRCLTREKTVSLLLIIFLGMSLASTFIGWSSHHTIQNVYSFSANELRAERKEVPPSPFLNAPHLGLVKNMIIYVVLIGSLLAISLGHAAGISDRRSGTSRVLFSNPINKTQFILGKIMGILSILLAVLLFSAVISAVSSFILSSISFENILQLFWFYAFSFIFLASFAILGLGFALFSNNEAIALLVPVILWLVIVFVLPEISSALYPTASLNPVLPQNTLNSPILDALHSAITPISVSEQYKITSENILGLEAASSKGTGTLNALPIFIWLFLCTSMAFFAAHRFEPASGELNE